MPSPRTPERLATIITIAVVAVVSAHAVANLGMDIVPKKIEFQSSWLYWAAVAAIGIPIFLAMDRYGRWVFSRPGLEKASSPVRITVVAFLISLGCAALLVLRQFLLDLF